MNTIYQYAHFTIAAVSSPDSAAGCFMQDSWPDTCMSVVDDTGYQHMIGARTLDGHRPLATSIAFADHYPLLTRGWVFQERVLSPRLLQCGYAEFTLDCLQSSHCECESSLPPHNSFLNTSIDSTFRRRRLPVRTRYRESNIEYWRQCVISYVRLGLTRQADVLDAISGCARAIAPLMQSEYVAGMWTTMLATDLLWWIATEKRLDRQKRGPDKSTVPSWS